MSRRDASVDPRLEPKGAFAVVMATGIISISSEQHGLTAVSLALVAVAGAAYVALVAAAIRKGRYALAGDLRSTGAFALLTFVAGTDVLASRAISAGERTLPLTLGVVALAAWLVLVPAALRAARSELRSARGEWLNLVVATQSLAVVGAQAPDIPPGARTAALILWLCGLVLYVALAPLAGRRAIRSWRQPREHAPDAWILPGALAISTLAAAELSHARPLGGATMTIAHVLWALACAGYLALTVLDLRVAASREGPGWSTNRWSMVFPLGMFSTASDAIGLPTLAAALLAIAGIAWLATAAVTLQALHHAEIA